MRLKLRLTILLFLLVSSVGYSYAAQQIPVEGESFQQIFGKFIHNETELYTRALARGKGWNILEEYDQGDIITSGGSVWISLQNVNTGNTVAENVWWTEVSGGSGSATDWTLQNQGTIHATNYVDYNTHIDQTGIEAFGFVTGAHTIDTNTQLSDVDIGALGYIKSYTETDPTAEPALGNPATDGFVISSTAAGVRSWTAMTDGGAVALPDLTDVTTTNPSNGQVLKYNGSSWGNAADDTGSGAVPSGSATNDILQWSGTEWIAHGQIDGLIDDTAGSGDTNVPWSADKITTSLAAKEDTLGNPATNGFILSSLTDGTRSWIEMTGGSGVDWTLSGQGTIHSTNYVDNNTQLSDGEIAAFGYIKTAGSDLVVSDESVSADTAVTKINFIGGGVTAVENADHEIDVTIVAQVVPTISISQPSGGADGDIWYVVQ